MSQPITIRLGTALIILNIILTCVCIYKIQSTENQLLIWLSDAEKERSEITKEKPTIVFPESSPYTSGVINHPKKF